MKRRKGPFAPSNLMVSGDRYDNLTLALHWSVAAFVLLQFALSLILIYRFLKTGGQKMLRMMAAQPAAAGSGGHYDHDHMKMDKYDHQGHH